MANQDTLTQPPVDDLICFMLYSSNHAMARAYLPHLKPLNLTYPQYIALNTLWATDGLTIGQICTKMGMDSGTITPLVKRLESYGHLRRQRSKTDERVVHVHLTPQGDVLRHKAPDVTACILRHAGLSTAELETLMTLLARLKANLAPR